MSLIWNGPHSVLVQPWGETQFKDGAGDPVYDYLPGEELTGVTVQPMTTSATESSHGNTQSDRYIIIGGGCWPGGDRAKITWHNDGDRVLLQDGNAKFYAMSPQTAHYEVAAVSHGIR